MVVIRAMFALALLSGVAAAEQLKSPSGEIVWIDDDHLQSALENGYKRVSDEEAARIVTKVADEPTKFDWNIVFIGAAITVVACGLWYVVRTRKR